MGSLFEPFEYFIIGSKQCFASIQRKLSNLGPYLNHLNILSLVFKTNVLKSLFQKSDSDELAKNFKTNVLKSLFQKSDSDELAKNLQRLDLQSKQCFASIQRKSSDWGPYLSRLNFIPLVFKTNVLKSLFQKSDSDELAKNLQRLDLQSKQCFASIQRKLSNLGPYLNHLNILSLVFKTNVLKSLFLKSDSDELAKNLQRLDLKSKQCFASIQRKSSDWGPYLNHLNFLPLVFKTNVLKSLFQKSDSDELSKNLQKLNLQSKQCFVSIQRKSSDWGPYLSRLNFIPLVFKTNVLKSLFQKSDSDELSKNLQRLNLQSKQCFVSIQRKSSDWGPYLSRLNFILLVFKTNVLKSLFQKSDSDELAKNLQRLDLQSKQCFASILRKSSD